ncbi:hypothetical protein [Clostridioides difficile]
MNIRNKTKKISLIQAKEILKQASSRKPNILVCYYDEDDNEKHLKIF